MSSEQAPTSPGQRPERRRVRASRRSIPHVLRSLWQRTSISPLAVQYVDLTRRGLALGQRIVLATDLHARDDWFPRELVATTVDAINDIPDVSFVTLVGDYVGDELEPIEWSSQEYGRITAPTYATLGNHDHWVDAMAVSAALEANGVEMLTNRAVPLAPATPAGAPELWLAGIDSCWTRRGSNGPGCDPEAAFAEVPDNAEAIVLGHEPHLATMHEHVLHLAGHTHRGQVRVPLLGEWGARVHMPRFSEPYPSGLYEVPTEQPSPLPARRRTSGDRRFVYTSGGVGYSTINLRILCPPEIVVLDV